MKTNKTVLILTSLILILSGIVSLIGLLTSQGQVPRDFLAVTGETIELFGSGIYRNDSISVVAQGIASDFVTLALALPVTIYLVYAAKKPSFRTNLVLCGMLGYFLYTYTSYVFLWTYNPLFIVYVALMSLSFFAFTIQLLSFDLATVKEQFTSKLKIRRIAGFQYFVALMIGMMWLGKLAPTWFSGSVPVGLEHYTTLTIQAMDLGFIVPVAIISATMLLKQKPFGYLLSSVILIKGIAMLVSITAMIFNMMLQGVEVSPIETGVFLLLDLILITILFHLVANVRPTPSIQ